MSTDTYVTGLSARLGGATTTAEVRQILAELLQLSRTHPEAQSLANIEERAFQYIRRAVEAKPDAAAEVLRMDVLPRCLLHDGSRRGDPWPRYSELFGEWLKDLPVSYQVEVRAAAISAAVDALDADNIPGAMRVIAQVGYADPTVCSRLEVICRAREDDIGERALAVRVLLGVAPEAQSRILEVLHNRLRRRATYRLFDVAKRVGNADTLDVLFFSWSSSREATGEARIDDQFALGALAAIASRQTDARLAEDLWRRVHALAVSPSGGKLFQILGSGILAKFSSPDVIPDLVDRIPHGLSERRWLTYSRLKECIQPIQTVGWDRVAHDALALVKQDAVAELNERGQFKTIEMHEKEDAWDVLLSVGQASLLPSIDEAIRHNTSGHVKHEFLELVACLGQSTLPGEVPRLLSASPPDAEWSRDELLIAQVGAVRVAHGAMSDEAFRSLLDYRPVRDGILISVLDALAELAGETAKRDDRNRLEVLLVTTESSSDETARSASGAALATLLQAGVLRPEEAARLAVAAAASRTDPFTRRALLYAFAARPEVSVSPELLEAAKALADPATSLSDDEQKAGIAAAGLMLYASRMTGDVLRSLQIERLGLVHTGDKVGVSAVSSVPSVAYHLVAHWYSLDPNRYASAVSALLVAQDPRKIAPLITAVSRVHTANPREVIDTLIARARRMDGGREAEPFILELLAEVAPDRLVTEEWPLLDRWMPQARAAMADSIGRLRAHPERSACERMLIRLAGDGLFGVRRSVYRAFSEFSPDTFSALVVGWAAAAEDAGIELRRRAAEAYRWVSVPAARDQLRELAWDPESSIREAFDLASADLREAEWTEFHLSRVLAATQPEEVIRLWRHGCALMRLGDDRTVSQLQQRSRDGLPPNIRFWLERIRKAVQRRWDDVVRKWPDPWFTRRGRYEVAGGVIQWADGRSSAVQAHLWFAAADHPDGYSSWGGWGQTAELSPMEALKQAFTPATASGKDHLIVDGRRPATILVTGTFMPSGHIVFSGSGPYPGDAEEE